MKKFLKYSLSILLIVIVYFASANYPKLDIITGYSSKMVASAVFEAGRSLESVEHIDNNFSPINLAENVVDKENNTVSSTLYGLKKNKAVMREGLGAVVVTDDYDEKADLTVPNRFKVKKELAYPYGDLEAKDSVFENINYEKLNEVVVSAFDLKPDKIEGTKSVLVIYKDHIIAEKYDEGFDPNTKLLGWSMTKSLTSAVYGVMSKKGMLNVNDPANVDEWKNDDRKNITYSNLLQMNSGLDWEEDYNKISDVTEMLYLDSDMSLKQIDKKLTGKPGESFYYSSGTSTLLSGYLMKKFFPSQQEYLDFWYRELIDKIGMHSMLLETDVVGNVVGSSYSWATTRDWAKFGLLYLHKGNWNGEQVLEESWVDYSVTPTPTSDEGYGAQIWLNKGGDLPDVSKDMFFFDGYQGQRVFIVPSKDLVVVRLGIDNTNKMDFNSFMSEIESCIE